MERRHELWISSWTTHRSGAARELDRFVSWLREEDLGRDPMFADLDERTFRRYAHFLVGRGNAKGTTRTYYADVSSFCGWAVDEGYMNDTATRGGRGMGDLRWHWPLHPGDELSVTVEVVNKEPAENIPTIGRVDAAVTATNQDETTVLTMVDLGLVKRREA